MTTPLLPPVTTEDPAPSGPGSPRRSVPPPWGEVTPAGRALQVTWLAWIAYTLWAAATLTDHPPPPAWAVAPIAAFEIATWATAGGLLARRRWAVGLSALLALPMVGVAAFCVLSGGGNHWMAEVTVATAVVAFTFHPGAWRMHAR